MNHLKIKLEPRSIASSQSSDVPEAIQKAFPYGMLQHQVEVYQAAKNHDIILDLAPTGTGKTNAGLSVIAHNRNNNAIYIAPTNALIEQQTEAASKFVSEAGLPHVVKAASAAHVKRWPDEKVGIRSGEKLYNVLRQPATIFPECAGKPLLLITNPDIFYYATFFAYNRLDQSNIASVFYGSFSTVIFDEFHLYGAKQLVSLLFYLTLSQVFGYFQYNRKIVLLTATPEPACEAALGELEKAGARIHKVDGETQTNQMLPSQTSVNLEIRRQLDKESLIKELATEVLQRVDQKPNQNGAVILDSLDQINRLNDKLVEAGIKHLRARITGPQQSKEKRHKAAQSQVILATSTVDVGFNFDRDDAPDRQNLDWLIFSSHDRFSFWQRIGRVGRVLGKKKTDIPSEAIAYLPEKAWEQGIENLDCSGGRNALKQTLENLDCMKRPFLEVYWKSEAFLEIARPLLEIETALDTLPEESLVTRLYETLKTILGGKRDWEFYRKRMQVLKGAENIANKSEKEISKDWKYIKGGQSFVISFIRAVCPEDWDDLQAKRISIGDVEKMILNDSELVEMLKKYALIYKESYAPLFRFRDSLFEGLIIHDPNCLLLDEAGETNLDPIHLLRFYEFDNDGDRIEILDRAETPYNLVFSLTVADLEEFRNIYLGKIYAFENCTISRMCGDIIRPTPSLIEKKLIPGVIVSESAKNRWAIVKLKKQGLSCYPIKVSDCFDSKEYLFFPSLSGILAIVSAGIALKCPDEEDFYIV